MADGSPAGPTEGTTPERRRVVRVVEVTNVAFLLVDVAIYGTGNHLVLAGRAVVAAGLLAGDLALSRLAGARALRPSLVGVVLTLVAGFGLLAAGSGGVDSPYLAFLAFVPIVINIAIPDEPAVTLVAGLAATVVGLGFGASAGRSPAQLGFTLAAFGSCAFYGTASALLYRRMRVREQAAAAARAEAVAELGRSEQRRLEAERLAAVGRLAAGLGHEVNSPLASAASNLRFARDELARAAIDPDVGAALSDAQEALERIRLLVADLRALSVEGGGQVADVDVAEALDQGLRLAQARHGPSAQADRRMPPDLPPVRASQTHLVQVLGLLVSAAREAVKDPGARGGDQAAPITVAVEVAGATVRISVEGGARSPAPAPPARNRSEVGLALCRELAERWGGRIEVGAAPDGRARFVLTLRSAAGMGPA